MGTCVVDWWIGGCVLVVVVPSFQHGGGVFALDVNPLHTHLMVTGSTGAEILVWDLNR